MASGITYDLTPLEVEKELYRVETGFRLDGGVNLTDATLADGSYLPPMAPLAVNFATRVAVAVKNVKVVEAALINATEIKVAKKSLAYVGMYLGKGAAAAQVTAIDKTNTGYDLLTITLGEAVALGTILFETNAPAAAVAGVKGVYTLTIGTAPSAADKLSLDGVEYVYAAAEGDAVYAVGADAKAAAANIEDAVSAQYENIFTVVARNGKITFTQVVAGVGAIPVLVVTQTGGGTLAATIAQTTEGVSPVAAVATTPKNVANYMNYARTKVEAGATVTLLGQAYQVKEALLDCPVNAFDKAGLTSRFMFE